MYLISVFKNLFKVSNIGTFIFFILNAAIIISLFASAGTETLAIIIVIYIFSIVIALSPIGEFVLGIMSGAKTMKRVDMINRITPIANIVKRKVKIKSPELPDIIKIKYINDPNPNAFAIGRKTVCVTEGIFGLPDEMIEGILAHEFAHLALHHTDIQLLIGGGNFIITGFILILKAISAFFAGISMIATLGSKSLAKGCVFSIVGAFCTLIIWLWTKFCMLFLMWSSRNNEYEADKYAKEIGFGYELALALDTIGTGVPQNSFLKALYSTHPDTDDRIGKLQAMGVPYSRY